jgi:hypothetical protein
MKLRLFAVSLILFAGFSTAQDISDRQVETMPVGEPVELDTSNVSVDPGLVKAGGLLYGFDVAVDNALVTAGLHSQADVALERASEAKVAADRNNTRGIERAVNGFNNAVEEADNRDVERLRQAESILGNVSSRVPEQAQVGISTALENVERAKQRVPDEFSTDGALPDVKLPGGGPSTDVESPVDDSER